MTSTLESPERRTALAQSLAIGAGLAGVFASDAGAAGTPGGRRLILTANNAQGKSYVVSDRVVTGGELWHTTPDEPMGPRAPGESKTPLPATATQVNPGPGATRWTFATIPPWEQRKRELEGLKSHDSRGMHRTSTIDYVLVVEGELHLLLDEGQVVLRSGDMVIQRNTAHAWQNHTSMPVVILAVAVQPANS